MSRRHTLLLFLFESYDESQSGNLLLILRREFHQITQTHKPRTWHLNERKQENLARPKKGIVKRTRSVGTATARPKRRGRARGRAWPPAFHMLLFERKGKLVRKRRRSKSSRHALASNVSGTTIIRTVLSALPEQSRLPDGLNRKAVGGRACARRICRRGFTKKETYQ